MSCVRGCCETQAEHYRSVRLSTGPTQTSRKESQLDTDLAAYKRLTQNGVKPKTFVGAAEFERKAQSKVEIERGHLIRNDRLRREVESHASGAA